MIPVLMEAALRALLVAVTVWAGLRLLRVSNVVAQKAAWGLVLAAAAAMPLLMRWEILPASMALRVPVTRWHAATGALQPKEAALLSTETVGPSRAFISATTTPGQEAGTGGRFPAPAISAKELSLDSSTAAASAPGADRTAEVFLQTDSGTAGIASKAAAMRLADAERFALILYFVVCAVLLARMLYGLGMAIRLWMSSEPFQTEPGSDPDGDPSAGMRPRFSFAISSPVTIGSGVLLPAECLDWDREKLCIVLAHERAHVRQGDFYLQLLAGLYAATFWFSPLGWWLKRELSDLSEAISDRAGLEEAASSASYAQVLLEFAAMPRPTVLGVAMAGRRNLSYRIERFLNETSFSQAFAGGRRRILAAVLLVPVALFAGTALIRVEAAASVQTAVANLALVSGQAAPTAPTAPDAVPAPPAPPQSGEIRDSADDRSVSISHGQDATITETASAGGGRTSVTVGRGATYSYSSDGDSWALVTDANKHVRFNGEWNDGTKGDLDKVRKRTSGKFLWFERDGKSYFLDDPGIVSQIEGMYKPMDELGRKQEELGKQQEDLGRQQEELGRRQEQARVPTPDMSKELAELNTAVAKLNAKKGGTVSQEELADLQEKISGLQGRLGDLQGEMGEKQGELGALQGELGAKQGKLGGEQGRLGAEEGRIAQEVDRKVKSIIDQSLRNGKARPVE